MREKLEIANKLRKSRKIFSNNLEHKRLCSKYYRTYVVECIIKGMDEFKITFNVNFINKFPERYLIGIFLH